MSTSVDLPQPESEVYDVVGFGLGPANLALLAALDEESEAVHGRRLKHLFVEQKESFCWHPGMLLEGAQIQLSFLKDLVTLRNPQSRYTFLAYLKEKGRLDKFANLRKFYPTRLEFNDYYGWVAGQLTDNVLYGTIVESVDPVENEETGLVEVVRVRTRNLKSNETRSFLARNLVVATGGTPNLPRGVGLRKSQRTMHTSEFLLRKDVDFPDRNKDHRFVVVGSGQSAAEIFENLCHNYPNADVTAAIRRFAYQPADDSHFVNEIFFPKMEDFLYDLPEKKRQLVIDAHRDTNYSCVDGELIESIYEFLYMNEVKGVDRARIEPFLELRDIHDEADGTVLEFYDLIKEESRQVHADYAILATGYVRPKRHPLIDNLSEFLVTNGADGYKVDRYYRIGTQQRFMPQLFLQGFCEDTHGLSDTLLSTLPIRSYDILKSLMTEDVAREKIARCRTPVESVA